MKTLMMCLIMSSCLGCVVSKQGSPSVQAHPAPPDVRPLIALEQPVFHRTNREPAADSRATAINPGESIETVSAQFKAAAVAAEVAPLHLEVKTATAGTVARLETPRKKFESPLPMS